MEVYNAAVIDVGSNSLRLCIASVSNGIIVKTDKYIRSTRLAEGLNETGSISDSACERSIDVLDEFKNIALKKNSAEIFCFATSAVRDAKNGKDFIDKVFKRTGICVSVLSGDDEAKAGYLGAVGRIDDSVNGVIDIGGGSTEMIVGKGNKILFSKSIRIGAVRLLDIAENGVDIYTYIKQSFEKYTGSLISYKDSVWTGIGGTITSLAAIYKKMTVYRSDLITGTILGYDIICDLLSHLSKMDENERKNVPGLQPERADIIIPGVMILKAFMSLNDIKKIKVSDSDNTEGFLISHI